MEKQPSLIPALESTGVVDHSFDELFESTSSSRLPESDSTDIWDEPLTPSRPAETIDTDSLWGDSVTPTSTPPQEFSGVDLFSSERFVAPNPVQEAGGGLFQRIRNAASRENIDSALERVTEVASALGGMAVGATVSAAGVVKAKAGEAVEATKAFVMDEENQETAKRIGAATVKVAAKGAFGDTGLGVLNNEGSLNKAKAARVVLRAIRNPGGVAATAGKGIIQLGRTQTTALGIDLAKNRLA